GGERKRRGAPTGRTRPRCGAGRGPRRAGAAGPPGAAGWLAQPAAEAASGAGAGVGARGCGKEGQIPPISKKCYVPTQFPGMELRNTICHRLPIAIATAAQASPSKPCPSTSLRAVSLSNGGFSRSFVLSWPGCSPVGVRGGTKKEVEEPQGYNSSPALHRSFVLSPGLAHNRKPAGWLPMSLLKRNRYDCLSNTPCG